MKWVRVSDYAIRSDDGRFTICRVGTQNGDRYELWSRAETGGITANGWHLVGAWPTPEQAKAEAS